MSLISTNTSIPFIHGEEIIEWDIHSANTSLMRYYKLCDEKLIEKAESLKKDERVIFIGKMMRKSKDFAINLENAFTSIMKEFIKVNNLQEEDIVSFKKDAVFVRNKKITTSKFGEVEFIPKNKYSGLILIPGYEFYYSENTIDVKGISDDVLPLHKDGVLAFISNIMEVYSSFNDLNRFLKSYSDAYKKRELYYNAYREFTSDSKFRVMMFGEEVLMDEINDELLQSTNIIFNYMKIYLPILKLLQL